MQEKQEVINDSEKLKSSKGDEHNDDDEDVIVTSFPPWLLLSRPVS